MFKVKITEAKKVAIRKAIHSVKNTWNPKRIGFWVYWGGILILGLIFHTIFHESIISIYTWMMLGMVCGLIIATIIRYLEELKE